ncbi:major facilitator superfamily domain-containing protein [Lasiosphaeria miniovina]|uniref:Major facilitator superfamily domain-containing protein n=1 Tax=Lasiosphaeria miniovina TaxID=1954250 RepID=A0AA39ZZ52_9PEZI|nr:major facilitator superfamily domain-containing protein [Lasiosphaeria miniovina]KAK0706285.1 major facilitator superfamily domain-containing protein [Lasiosphaeria miniovina]
MSFEKAAPTGNDVGGEVQRSPDESQVSHGPGNKSDEDAQLEDAQLEDDTPPDGGAAAWLVVLGGWCCSFNSMGWMNSVGVFQQYYENGPLEDYDSSTISWIPSLELFFLFFLGPVVGILFDKYGPRPLIIVGTFFHVFGLMMASLATTYYQFLLSQGVCSAVGLAFLYPPALACISTWFSQKRGVAMGIMVTGSSVGGVIFPIMLNRLVQNPSTGYPWAIRIAAFLVLALQIVAILTIRPRSKLVPKRMPAGALAAPFKELPFLTMVLGISVLTYGIFIPVNYLALQGFLEAHVPADMSLYLVSIFNAASLFGRLGAGYWADFAGRWNVFIIACALSGITELALWIPATYESAVIGFAVMYGFVSGAFIGLFATLPASVSPVPEIGYRMGVVMLFISLPALTMAPIGGQILQNSADGWLHVKIFGGVMCLAGSAIVLYGRVLYTKKFWVVF